MKADPRATPRAGPSGADRKASSAAIRGRGGLWQGHRPAPGRPSAGRRHPSLALGRGFDRRGRGPGDAGGQGRLRRPRWRSIPRIRARDSIWRSGRPRPVISMPRSRHGWRWSRIRPRMRPGARWWRRQIEETAKKLGRDPATLPGRKPAPRPPPTAERRRSRARPQRGGYGQGRGHDAGAAGRLHRQHGEGPGRPAEGASRAISTAGCAWPMPMTSSAAPTMPSPPGTRPRPGRRTGSTPRSPMPRAGAVRAERGAPPADFEATVARAAPARPRQSPGPLLRRPHRRGPWRQGRAAKGFWQKLLPVLPEGSPQRQQIEARIAALGN